MDDNAVYRPQSGIPQPTSICVWSSPMLFSVRVPSRMRIASHAENTIRRVGCAYRTGTLPIHEPHRQSRFRNPPPHRVLWLSVPNRKMARSKKGLPTFSPRSPGPVQSDRNPNSRGPRPAACLSLELCRRPIHATRRTHPAANQVSIPARRRPIEALPWPLSRLRHGKYGCTNARIQQVWTLGRYQTFRGGCCILLAAKDERVASTAIISPAQWPKGGVIGK
jgi:hypothetical protein